MSRRPGQAVGPSALAPVGRWLPTGSRAPGVEGPLDGRSATRGGWLPSKLGGQGHVPAPPEDVEGDAVAGLLRGEHVAEDVDGGGRAAVDAGDHVAADRVALPGD